jgi:hypothetical protein
MTRILNRGATGVDVKNLQSLLNFHLKKVSPFLMEDGSFGAKTDLRLRDFQKRNRLSADGSVGPQTRHKLLQLVRIQAVIQVFKGGDAVRSSNEVGASSPNLKSKLTPANNSSALVPAVADFGGKVSFPHVASRRMGVVTQASSGLASTSNRFLGIELDHELKLDFNLLAPSDGETNSWLDGSIEAKSGQPFKAEVKAEEFKTRAWGPFELSGFTSGSLDLKEESISLGTGLDLDVTLLKDSAGRTVIGLGVEGSAVFSWEPIKYDAKLHLNLGGGLLLKLNL